MNIISNHLDTILEEYSTGNHYDVLKKAKEQYFSLTGKLDEDAPEYESRMNIFNDWYIFNFKKDDGIRIVEDYIKEKNLEDDLAKALHNTNYSLFHYVKDNFRKKIVLKDVLHNRKYILEKENIQVGIISNDLFVGRVVELNDVSFLLKGICSLPVEILGKLKKEAKKVRKLNNREEEENYLIKLEKLKTKSLNYGHIEASKIFTFN